MTDEAETQIARLKYRSAAGKIYFYAYITASARIAF